VAGVEEPLTTGFTSGTLAQPENNIIAAGKTKRRLIYL
jgi:hypothetical protein